MYVSCFRPWSGTSCAKCLLSWNHFISKIVIIYGHFLKPTDSILSESCDRLSSLNFTQYTVLPRNIENTDYCDSLHPMFTMSCGHFACRIKLATCVVYVTFLLYYRSLLDRIAILRTYRCGLLLCRPSSVVCVVCRLSVTLVSPAKTAEPIELPFEVKTLVGPGTMYYMEFRSPMGGAIFLWGGGASHCKV